MKGKIPALVLMVFGAFSFGLWQKSAAAGWFMLNVLGLISGLAIRMYEDRHK